MQWKKRLKIVTSKFANKMTHRHFRIQFFIYCVTFAFCILQIKLIIIFFLPSVRYNKHQETNTAEQAGSVKRLDIIDRNGVLLARNVTAFDFYVYPHKMLDMEQDLNKIIDIFPSLEERKQGLFNSFNAKKIDGKAVLVKQNIFSTEKQKILNAGILGIEFQETERRIYPHNNVASHILGFLSIDRQGMAGVERYFNNYLSNTSNQNSIQLSIDINIQNITRHVLENAIAKVKAQAGSAIIVNVKTGELIAAVSLPDFNPNNLKEYNNNDLFNRFSLGVYELGSVFKIFLIAQAIENRISITKQYNTKDPFVVGDFVIHNFAADRVRDKMNMTEILQHSSNVGCARIIEEMGNFYQQKELFQRLGLLDKLSIELSEIGRPIYKDKWKLTQAITRSYGHGIAVTPLNFIYAVASIINNGKSVTPTLLKVNEEKNGSQLPAYVISEPTSRKVRDILRTIVNEGTGRQGAAEKYDVGGKTGTAVKVENKTYDNKRKNLVSFVAAVPIKDPQYIYYIVLDEPSAENINVLRISGGRMAAPAMNKLISITGPMLDMPIEKN